jgi:hypothetical protein
MQIKAPISKLALLRPVHFVVAGFAGARSVCVYVIYQNVKLMIK